MSKIRVISGIALASGAAWMALGTPAFPSVYVSSASPPASLELQTDAMLQAKGARILVSINYLCPKYAYAWVDVSVSQRAGSVITTGDGSARVSCTGNLESASVSVTARTKPFKKGPAAAEAWLYGDDSDVPDDAVIRIK